MNTNSAANLFFRLTHRISELLKGKSTRGYLTIHETPFPKGVKHQQEAMNFIYDSFADSALKSLPVQDGPFAGLNYYGVRSSGSALYPKILGTYEREIASIFSKHNWSYDVFVDIGCGEGYYVNGVRYLNPACQCYGFDTNRKAIENARVLASSNGLRDGIYFFDSEFSFESVVYDGSKKYLFMIDTEGAELDIFREILSYFNAFGSQLSSVDFLIELHPMYSIERASSLLNEISKCTSKSLEKITAISDFDKVLFNSPESIRCLSPSTQFLLLRERHLPTPWLYIY